MIYLDKWGINTYNNVIQGAPRKEVVGAIVEIIKNESQ